MFPETDSTPVCRRVVAAFGPEIIAGSAIVDERLFRDLFAVVRPRTVLEIGTRFGVSSALFADMAGRVITVDIARCPAEYPETARRVWEHLGVRDKIVSHYAAGASIDAMNADKKAFCRRQSFDFAFVDGHHSRKAVAVDFACVKRCGCVLFHDYKPDTPEYAACPNMRMPEAVMLMDALRPRPYLLGEHCSRMALWVSRDHPMRRDPDGVRFLAALPRVRPSWLGANATLFRARLAKEASVFSGRVRKLGRSIRKRLR